MGVPIGRRLAAEVVGTFGFFFMGFMAIAASVMLPRSIGSAGIAAGFGLGLMMMVFAFGHISGGHYNPAVTLGLACGRRFPFKELPAYWLAQLVGGIAAALVVRATFNSVVAKALVNQTAPGVSAGKAVVFEGVATLLFLLVVSTVATDKTAPWNGVLAPVAIGGFIFLAATAVGPFTSGSFNPARSLAPAIVAGDYSQIWIFLVGPLVGGAIGGWLYSVMREPETVVS
jgi:MIP family channel proteins